jgi:hypothetical protein
LADRQIFEIRENLAVFSKRGRMLPRCFDKPRSLQRENMFRWNEGHFTELAARRTKAMGN